MDKVTIKDLVLNDLSLEKKAFEETVKSLTGTAIAELVRAGIPFEKAASVVKEASEQADEFTERKRRIMVLSKVAEYVEEVEEKVSKLEKVAEQVRVQEETPSEVKESIEKLASVGFTEEEIEHMKVINQGLIEKMAKAATAPASMGGRVGVPREKTDALLEFLLS
jgi:uncharacterized protein YoxC